MNIVDGTMDMAAAEIINPSVSLLAGLEQQLAQKLAETTDEVQHVECFDDEQRAEVFAILQALRLDNEAHRSAVDLLSRRLKGGIGDA